MRHLVHTLAIVVLAAGAASAQTSDFGLPPDSGLNGTDANPAGSSDAATDAEPSYGSYEPPLATKSLVQQKAMFRNQQRQLRIEARRWYGFSQSRPTVFASPYWTSFDPIWVGRNWTPYYGWYGGRSWY